MMRIAIVDDEEIVLEAIHRKVNNVLKKTYVKYELYDYTEGRAVSEDFDRLKFDLIFLDIDLPDISGMDIARDIREKESSVDIIFITNQDDFVYDAIKFSPFRFIRKSRFEAEIEEGLEDFICKYSKANHVYIFSTPNGKRRANPVSIKYIEVNSHKLNIHDSSETFVANGNLKDIEVFFYNYGFIKIHQSYLVNYRFMKMINHRNVILDDGTVLPLSRGKLEQTKICYMRYSRENWS